MFNLRAEIGEACHDKSAVALALSNLRAEIGEAWPVYERTDESHYDQQTRIPDEDPPDQQELPDEEDFGGECFAGVADADFDFDL